MTCIIYYEEMVWAIMLTDEILDMSFQRMLCFIANIELGESGLIVEAVAEEGLKFLCLAHVNTRLFINVEL